MTTLSRKMIGYALGRNPQASDRRLIGEMVRAGGDASFTDLATAIATSRQFRFRAGRRPARVRARAGARRMRRPSPARPPGFPRHDTCPLVVRSVAPPLPSRCRGRAHAALAGVAARLRQASAGQAAAKAASGPPLRLGIVYFSNGVEPAHWWAKGSGATMELGPGLMPMLPHREDMVFIRGLYSQSALASTSPHLGRMNLLSGAARQPRPRRDPRRDVDGPGDRGSHRRSHRRAEPGARCRAERAAPRGRALDGLRIEPVLGVADAAGHQGDLSGPDVRPPGGRRHGTRARPQHPRRGAGGGTQPRAARQPCRPPQARRVLRGHPRHREAHRSGPRSRSVSRAGGRRSRSRTCRGRSTSCRRTCPRT